LLQDGEATVLVNDLAASQSDLAGNEGWTTARIASGEEFAQEEKLCNNRPVPMHYNPYRMREELRANAKFVLVRGDKFVFAACRDREELEDALRSLPGYLHVEQMSRPLLAHL